MWAWVSGSSVGGRGRGPATLMMTPPPSPPADKFDLEGKPTSSAHPARFSPDDKFSRHRVTVKKRFGLLLTQQPRPVL
ncbi:hypothetical protein CRUP_004384 [Coryphaenoides rupestris]|nr:hypothetical protein CRUP_004384 [Coryphaenoides rupestris]